MAEYDIYCCRVDSNETTFPVAGLLKISVFVPLYDLYI